MRLAKAQPPAALRVLGRAVQELGEERGELFDRAAQSLSGKERAQHGIARHGGEKRGEQFGAWARPANRMIQIEAVHEAISIYIAPERIDRNEEFLTFALKPEPARNVEYVTSFR